MLNCFTESLSDNSIVSDLVMVGHFSKNVFNFLSLLPVSVMSPLSTDPLKWPDSLTNKTSLSKLTLNLTKFLLGFCDSFLLFHKAIRSCFEKRVGRFILFELMDD